MTDSFPYSSAVAALAAAVLTPLILSVLQKNAPSRTAGPNEREALAVRFGLLEKIAFLAMWAGLALSVAAALSMKPITLSSLLLMLGSLGIGPVACVGLGAAWKRDRSVWTGFWRFQEIQYHIAAGLQSGTALFLALLALAMTIVVLAR